MADLYAIFGTLLALGIAFPGLLAAWWLLFPRQVAVARTRLEQTPWRCLWSGLPIAAAVAIASLILFSLPIPFSQPLGALVLIAGLGVAAVGAAGIASRMAGRLREHSGAAARPFGSFVLAAVALELAVAFPFVGWFLVLPVAIVMSLGAAFYGVTGRPPRDEPSNPEPADAQLAGAA